MNGKEIIELLRQNGWQLVRVRGKKDIGIGLLKALEKQTGVKLK